MSRPIQNRLLLLLLIFNAVSMAATDKIYSWRDKNGVLVFSDSPPKSAARDVREVKIDDKAINIPMADTSILQPAVTPMSPRSERTTTDQAASHHITITQPADQSTIRDNAGTVQVSASISPDIDPNIAKGQRLLLKLDGKPWDKPRRQGRFMLSNIDRGEHQIVVELINAEGKVIAVSPVHTFHMHRHSILAPN